MNKTKTDAYDEKIFFCIGLSDKMLFYRYEISGKSYVDYTSSVINAMSFEHYTDACIHIHGEIKDGNKDAELYKVYKIVCTINECSNQPKEVKGNEQQK